MVAPTRRTAKHAGGPSPEETVVDPPAATDDGAWEELQDQHKDLPRQARRPEFRPANEVEKDLLRAAAQNDHDLFLQTLADADVLLPVPEELDYTLRPGRPGFPWQAADIEGVTFVPMFTSPERLVEAAAATGTGSDSIKLPFTVAMRYWPDPRWALAINSGSRAGGTIQAEQLPGLAKWADERAARRLAEQFEPQNDVEQRLFEAARRRDTDTFFKILLGAQVLVPADADTPWGISPDDREFPWRPVPVHGQTSIQVFTSLKWMNEAIGSSRFVMPSLLEMVAAWPDTEWTLVLNPGTPIDATMPGEQVRALSGPPRTTATSDRPAEAKPTAAQPTSLRRERGAPPTGAQPTSGQPTGAAPATPGHPADAGAPPGGAAPQGPAAQANDPSGTPPTGQPNAPAAQPPTAQPSGLAPSAQAAPGQPDDVASQPADAQANELPGQPTSAQPNDIAARPAGAPPSDHAGQPLGKQPGGTAAQPAPGQPDEAAAQATGAQPASAQPSDLTGRTTGDLTGRTTGDLTGRTTGGVAAQPSGTEPTDTTAPATPGQPDEAATQPTGAQPNQPRGDVTAQATGAQAAPDQVQQPEEEFEPGNRIDQELYEAALAGDSDAFLRVLLAANVLVPIPQDAALEVTPIQQEFRWEAALREPSAVQVFTSLVRLREVLPESRFVYADFRELIGSWPHQDWAMLLNPGTRIGASLRGDQVHALSEWAVRVGLVQARPEVPVPPAPQRESESAYEPPQSLSDPEPEPTTVPEPTTAPAQPYRTRPPMPTPEAELSGQPTVMQKVVPHSHVSWYLEQGYDRVGGFVHPTSDVADLQTPVQLYEALGLLYEDSPFDLGDDGVYVIRWPAYCGALYRIPFGGQTEEALEAWGDAGWVIERPPFQGGGFAPGSAGSIREYKVDSVRLPYGAEMYYLGTDRSERFVAMYDPDRLAWLRPQEETAGGTDRSEAAK
ncbi:SseB family protein [Actinomadura rudentiformis]|uniref:SseB family protein n=1 Tax=Actinomadura rudentiformis TaxID=359158 RepID=UPI0021F4FCA4|nr:SseB family protein [Actinomadura rudentiformis]